MGVFFIDTETGRVATQAQLIETGLASATEDPPRPWHRIRGTRDASTLWYAVLRRRTKGIFIGTLVLRHSDHHASLLADDWQEVAPEQIGLHGTSELSPSPVEGW